MLFRTTRDRIIGAVAVLAALAGAWGCSTSLSTSQPAHHAQPASTSVYTPPTPAQYRAAHQQRCVQLCRTARRCELR